MTTVNVNEDKYSVTVTEGATTVVTVKAPGPQGPGFPDGNLGDVTSSNTGASVVVNSGAITNAKVNDSAAIAGTKISPDFGSQNITTTGNAVFGGNLTVSGTTTTIDSTTLRVEDKNIELGKVGSPTDITADGGGITLLGDTNHTFNWINATDSWTSSEHIALPDNKELKLGSAGEVRLSHTGTSTNFIVSQHFFNLQANGYFFYNQAGNETLLSLEQNGAVKLYHDNIKRLETASNGAACHGRLTMHGDIVAADNHAIKLGTGLDFTLVHDGTHSVISTNSGNLKLEPKPGEKGIVIVPDGSAELYHDNVKILQTQSWGTHVFGSFVANGDVKINLSTGRLRIGVNDEFTVRHNSTNLIAENTVGNIHLRPKTAEEGIKLIPDGAVELYHDNVKKAETASNGLNVEGIVTCDDILLANAIFHEGQTNTKIEFDGTQIKLFSNAVERLNISQFGAFLGTGYKLLFTSVTGESPFIRSFGTTNGDIQIGVGTDSMAQFKRDGAVELYYDNALKFTTKSFGATAFGTLTANGGDIKTINATSSTDTNSFLLANSTGNALQVTHTSSNSYIRNLVGSLFIEPKSGETGIKVIPDGAVELYHDNVKKVETTSNGVTVNGHLLASTDGNTSINLLDTGHGFSASEIKLSNGGRDLNITAPKDIRLFPQAGENGIVIEGNGQIELYHDNVKRFNTTADAVDVHGHLNLGANTDDKRLRFGINNDLQLYHDATDSHILNSTGILKINSTSGVAITGGLLFGSDTADANKLEDYEEGTWTPTFNGLTASNTGNACFYIKIGDMVTAWFRATMPTSSDTTTARIQGLPFNIYNSSGIGIAGGAFSETNAGSDLSMIGNANTDNMFVLECNSSGVTVKTLAQISGKDFRGSITYRVA